MVECQLLLLSLISLLFFYLRGWPCLLVGEIIVSLEKYLKFTFSKKIINGENSERTLLLSKQTSKCRTVITLLLTHIIVSVLTHLSYSVCRAF